MSCSERRGVEELGAFDFTLVRSRLVQQGLLREEWGDLAILEFRRYLALRLLSPEPVMMLSAVVDEVWQMQPIADPSTGNSKDFVAL